MWYGQSCRGHHAVVVRATAAAADAGRLHSPTIPTTWRWGGGRTPGGGQGRPGAARPSRACNHHRHHHRHHQRYHHHHRHRHRHLKKTEPQPPPQPPPPSCWPRPQYLRLSPPPSARCHPSQPTQVDEPPSPQSQKNRSEKKHRQPNCDASPKTRSPLPLSWLLCSGGEGAPYPAPHPPLPPAPLAHPPTGRQPPPPLRPPSRHAPPFHLTRPPPSPAPTASARGLHRLGSYGRRSPASWAGRPTVAAGAAAGVAAGAVAPATAAEATAATGALDAPPRHGCCRRWWPCRRCHPTRPCPLRRRRLASRCHPLHVSRALFPVSSLVPLMHTVLDFLGILGILGILPLLHLPPLPFLLIR